MPRPGYIPDDELGGIFLDGGFDLATLTREESEMFANTGAFPYPSRDASPSANTVLNGTGEPSVAALAPRTSLRLVMKPLPPQPQPPPLVGKAKSVTPKPVAGKAKARSGLNEQRKTITPVPMRGSLRLADTILLTPPSLSLRFRVIGRFA